MFGEVNGKQGNANVISGIHEVASLKHIIAYYKSNTLYVWRLNRRETKWTLGKLTNDRNYEGICTRTHLFWE